MSSYIKKTVRIISVLICSAGLCASASEPQTVYSEPETLVSDFLNAYFNVSLDEAEELFADIERQIEEQISKQEPSAETGVAETQIDMGKMAMQEFFTEDGLEAAVNASYQLMMFRAAVEFHSDVVLEDVVWEEDSAAGRYTFDAAVGYPAAQDSGESETEAAQETESGERAADQIHGYIDVVETDGGWMIDAFKIRSGDGSY